MNAQRFSISLVSVFVAGVFLSLTPVQAEIPCVHSEVSNVVSFAIKDVWFVRKIEFRGREAFIDSKDTGYVFVAKDQSGVGWTVELYNTTSGIFIDSGILYACLPCPETAYYIRWRKRSTTRKEIIETYDGAHPNVFTVCNLTDEQLRAYSEMLKKKSDRFFDDDSETHTPRRVPKKEELLDFDFENLPLNP